MIADEGRTVIFSSHLLAEVEQVSDRVVMVQSGRVVLDEDLTRLKQTHYRIDLILTEGRAEPPDLQGAIGWQGEGKNWSAVWHGDVLQLDPAVAIIGGKVVGKAGVSLDDIFVAHAGRDLK